MLEKLRLELPRFVDEADSLSHHIKGSLQGVLARGVRVSTTDTGVPPMNLSPFLGPPPGVSGATSAIIAPGR
jgi:hypothetical protein